MPRNIFLLLVCCGLLPGCVTAPRMQRTPSYSKLKCDEAVGTGIGYGRGSARAVAESSARQQLGDVRGYLLASGASRVRPSGSEVTCRPYALGGGLTQCVSVVRLCGR